MIFADYLSKTLSGNRAPESEDDKKFAVKTFHEIIHLLLKHNIESTGILKTSGNLEQSNDSTQNERNDATHTIHNTHREEHIFWLNLLKNKSLRTNQNFIPNNNSKLIAITTRQNRNRDTFDIQIKKRKRPPTKKQSKWIQLPPQTSQHGTLALKLTPNLTKEKT